MKFEYVNTQQTASGNLHTGVVNLIGIGTPRGVLHNLVLTILLFNLVDAFCTLAWIEAGIAREVNVFMKYLIDHGYGVFVTVKMTLVVAGLTVLWAQKHHKLASTGIVSLAAVHFVLVLYHVYFGVRFAISTNGPELANLSRSLLFAITG